jgi:hypothetical protein
MTMLYAMAFLTEANLDVDYEDIPEVLKERSLRNFRKGTMPKM